MRFLLSGNGMNAQAEPARYIDIRRDRPDKAAVADCSSASGAAAVVGLLGAPLLFKLGDELIYVAFAASSAAMISSYSA